MFKVKKDYLIGIRTLAIIYSIVIAITLMLYLIIRNNSNSEFLKVTYEFVATVVEIGIATIAIAPAATLFSIVPLAKNNSDFIMTAHLPLSKKQIMLDGIKRTLPYFIVWIILSNIVLALFKTSISNEGFVNMYFQEIFNSIKTISVVVIIELQVMAATILAYVKDIEWYKVVPIQTLLNVMIVIACYSILNIINFDMAKDMTWLIIIGVSIVVFSIIEFIYSFRYIEEVCK